MTKVERLHAVSVGTVVRKWTAQDEARLQELLARRQEIMDENRSTVVTMLERNAAPTEGSTQTAKLADWLIEHASEVRDSLLPFVHAAD